MSDQEVAVTPQEHPAARRCGPLPGGAAAHARRPGQL